MPQHLTSCASCSSFSATGCHSEALHHPLMTWIQKQTPAESHRLLLHENLRMQLNARGGIAKGHRSITNTLKQMARFKSPFEDQDTSFFRREASAASPKEEPSKHSPPVLRPKSICALHFSDNQAKNLGRDPWKSDILAGAVRLCQIRHSSFQVLEIPDAEPRYLLCCQTPFSTSDRNNSLPDLKCA
jgi:hypothetical protein